MDETMVTPLAPTAARLLAIYTAMFAISLMNCETANAQSKLGSVRQATRKKEVRIPRQPKPTDPPRSQKAKAKDRQKNQAKPNKQKRPRRSKPVSRVASRNESNASQLQTVRNEVRKRRPSRPAMKPHRGHEAVRRARPRRNRGGFFGYRRPVVCPRPVVVATGCYEPVVHVTHIQPAPTIIAPAPQQQFIAPQQAPVAPPVPVPLMETSPTSETAMLDSPVTEVFFQDDSFQSSFGTLWATVGTDFDDFSKADFGVRFQAPGSIGIETSVVNLRESVGAFRDHIWLGDVNVTYEAINRGNVRGRLGLGVNWLNDGWGSVAGFNLTTGVDVRLNPNWMLVGEADLGSLGDADFFHGRLSLNRRFGNVEWATGIDHLDIGGVDITTGFTGIQFRF